MEVSHENSLVSSTMNTGEDDKVGAVVKYGVGGTLLALIARLRGAIVWSGIKRGGKLAFDIFRKNKIG